MAVLTAVALGLLLGRNRLLGLLPSILEDDLRCLRFDCRIERDVGVPMRDGVRLATNLYFPESVEPPLATVLMRLPYDKNAFGSARAAALRFAKAGFAVAVQDVRGKFASGGVFAPWQDADLDGSDTIDWIARQPWSNGKVGTFGCSALGETQMILARTRNPRHAALIALGAGGAMGSGLGRYSYFGVFEGGIFQLASGFGWFAQFGRKEPGPDTDAPVPIASAVRQLPIVDLVSRHKKGRTDYEEFLRHPLTDPWWRSLGYIDDQDRFATPALILNTWQDQTVADTLALAALMKHNAVSAEAARNHFVVVGPGNHCGIEGAAEEGRVGDLPIRNASRPYRDWYVRWFDHWLRGATSRSPAFAPYQFFVLGEDRWLRSDEWPPRGATPQSWFLQSAGRANTRNGDGRLVRAPTSMEQVPDEFRYDPRDPVPSRGGPLCCTGDPSERPGPVDQGDVELRPDVLVYTSDPLAEAVRIAGPIALTLFVSSSARDTDFTAKLVDVWPDGRALNIQEGALRARYRDGFAAPKLMQPGERYRLEVSLRAIAWQLKHGHRLRLEVSSSNFPRLERNLNTGGNNFDESVGEIAVNRVYHETGYESALRLYVLPDSAAEDMRPLP